MVKFTKVYSILLLTNNNKVEEHEKKRENWILESLAPIFFLPTVMIRLDLKSF